MRDQHAELHQALQAADFRGARQYATAMRSVDPAWTISVALDECHKTYANSVRDLFERLGRQAPAFLKLPLVSSLRIALLGDEKDPWAIPSARKGSSTDLIPLLQDLAPKVTRPLFQLPDSPNQEHIVADLEFLLSTLCSRADLIGVNPQPLLDRLRIAPGTLGALLEVTDHLQVPELLLRQARDEHRTMNATRANDSVRTRAKTPARQDGL